MILLDFSAVMHQCIFSGVTAMKPKVDDEGCYITNDFIKYTKFYLLDTIFDVQTKFSNYGDVVFCLDDYSTLNWRKTVLKTYKSRRKSGREKSQIRYNEVFAELENFITNIKLNSPWRVVKSPGAEGDDVILVLAKHFAQTEKVLIVSSDKDMIQAQKYGNVQQYSLYTRKFVEPETKHADSLNDWLTEHVILGDACDDVPRVIDSTVFSDEFKNFLKSINSTITEIDFLNLDDSEQTKVENDFYNSEYGASKIIKSKKRNLEFEEKYPEVFKKERFGKSTLLKKIDEYGSLDNWLDSNALYKQNYERNKQLVLAEYIPDNIQSNIIDAFKNASNVYNEKEFRKYIEDNHLENVMINVPANFKTTLTEDFFKL